MPAYDTLGNIIGPLSEAEVRARIIAFSNPSEDPVLTVSDIDICVDMSRRIDYNGVWPTMSGWIPTYDWNMGIALAWLLKSGRLADRYLFMSGGKMFSRNQYYDHCMQQYRLFANKSGPRAMKLVMDRHIALNAIPNNAENVAYG